MADKTEDKGYEVRVGEDFFVAFSGLKMWVATLIPGRCPGLYYFAPLGLRFALGYYMSSRWGFD